MKTLSNFFIENAKLTVVLSLGLFVFGVMGLKRMNAESFPSVSMATATVVTPYDGASAADIETKITRPLEDEIRGVTGLKDVRSTSQAGLSTIVIRVDMDDPKIDVSDVMSEIQKAVDRTTDLPGDLKDPPKFTELKSEEFPVLELAITGGNDNRKRDLISDLLKEEIEDFKGIKGVRLTGFAPRAFQIKIDNQLMKKFHISTQEILDKIERRNRNTPGGALRSPRTQKLVRLEGKVTSATDLSELVIRSNFSGQTIRLKDVAIIEDSEEEITTRVRYNGEASTLIIVTKKGGADTRKAVGQIWEKLTQFKKNYPEYGFYIYNNEGLKVENRVNILINNAFSGLVLVIFFLFFFLPGKIGLAASLSLPLAVMGTLGLMPNMGMNIDTITVLALVIALGMLVDNSVVISENFTRLRRDGLSARDAASTSVSQLWLPISATAFTTIAAFLPMLVTKGVMGEFIKWIPIVVTMSLALSLVESFFFLPMRLEWAGKTIAKKKKGQYHDWFEKFELKFENFMSKLIKKRYHVFGIFTMILFFSLFMMIKANKFILFPADQTEIYIARIELPKGSRLEETEKVVTQISNLVRNKLGQNVQHVVGRAGVARMNLNDPKGQEGNNIGMLSIYVNDYAKYNIASTEMLSTFRNITLPSDVEVSFEALINGPPVGNPIEATFRSNNMDELDKLLKAIIGKMKTLDGVLDLKINNIIGDDEIYVNINYSKADQLGISVASIGNTLRAAISGKRISTVTLNNKDVDLIVRSQENFRSTLDDIKKITIPDGRGNLVALGPLVNFRIRSGPPQIKRFDFKRAKTLTGNVDETLITAFEANNHLKKFYDELSPKYPGVGLVFGGAAESTKESMDSLYQALVLSLIGIFALLVFLFKSYLRPLIIMTTIPLGLFGFSVAFFFHQRPISFLALIGIIGLGGIIVNSGIVLISFIDAMVEEGKLGLNEILAKASRLRLRAVLVTSLTTISGLLPTAYGIGGSDAILIPMTLAMAWGLTSGTLLTLIWVPSAYAILEDLSNFRIKLNGR